MVGHARGPRRRPGGDLGAGCRAERRARHRVTHRTFSPGTPATMQNWTGSGSWWQEGRLTPRIARILPADKAAEAHQLLDEGGLRGRLILTF
ncbi:zinc-binding dehydrogenase [Streptomyces sp. NPDC060209]|uniref:zinc-binding dehydrogenase n=1 Tax=Streptomyces sp. NPDC060209 TaxID=3347073 RepID=UPI00364EFEF6